MPLTDTGIRAARHGAKPIKLFDANGLFLLLQPSGGKLWRLKYRIGGKEKKFSIGRHPDVGLKEARRRRDEAREIIAAGRDPAEHKRLSEDANALRASATFQLLGDEYLAKAALEGREAVTIAKKPLATFTDDARHRRSGRH